jgi:hypothetical protein
VQALYERYKDRAEFLLVVIREAGHVIPDLDFVLSKDSKGRDYRRVSAAKAREALGITFPTVLDTPDAMLERLYAAWPARLFIVNADGEMAFDAGWIREAWDLDAVEEWLQQHV